MSLSCKNVKPAVPQNASYLWITGHFLLFQYFNIILLQGLPVPSKSKTHKNHQNMDTAYSNLHILLWTQKVNLISSVYFCSQQSYLPKCFSRSSKSCPSSSINRRWVTLIRINLLRFKQTFFSQASDRQFERTGSIRGKRVHGSIDFGKHTELKL